jgi:hypothetical protein
VDCTTTGDLKSKLPAGCVVGKEQYIYILSYDLLRRRKLRTGMSGTTDLPYGAGFEFPSELVRAILDQVVARYPRPKTPVSGSKLGLSAYSLTCRHWAEVIRPVIFRKIQLRQPEDVVQLLEFLDSGASIGPPLCNCIEELALHVYPAAVVTAVPCLHHYYKLVKRLHALRHTSIIMKDDQPAITHGPSHHLEQGLQSRSLLNILSSSLPKTLPGTIFPVHKLVLFGLQLRTVGDLVCVVNSLPTIRSFTGERLTFTDNVTAPRRTIRRKTSMLQRVFVTGCGDESLKSHLELCSMITNSRGHLGFSVDAWDSVHSTMLTVPNGHRSVSVELRAHSIREYLYNFCRTE